MLVNDKHGDNPGNGKNSFVHVVVRIDIRRCIAECGKTRQGNACKDAADGNVFGRKGQNAPDGKSTKGCDRSEGEENAKGCQNAFTASETRKAGKAMAEDREQTAYERKPEVIRTASRLGGFVHPDGNRRGKETF